MISVVVLAHGDEPVLAECLAAVLDSSGDDVEVVLVDNGSPAVPELARRPRLRVVDPGRNTGFSGGCELGARHARGDVLVLLNSDAVPKPGAVQALAAAVADPAIGIASGSVRLASAPDRMNTVGNPVQFLGVVWVGGYDEPAEQHAVRTDVAAASGAFLALRRDVWNRLGGFPTAYFAYHEDVELSLRAWQLGYRVVYEPSAVVVHHYVHDRSELKHYLVRRNRLLTVLTVYPPAVLACVLPALVLFELGQLVVAVRHRAVRRTLRSWVGVLRRAGWIRRRRLEVQPASTLSPDRFAALLSARIEPRMIARPPAARALNVWLSAYWWVVRRVLTSARARPAR